MPLTNVETLQQEVDRLLVEVGRLREENKKIMVQQELYSHTLFGSAEDKGLVHVVKDINEKFNTMTKLGWLILGAGVAQFVATVWGKLT